VLGVAASNAQSVSLDAERVNGAIYASDTWLMSPRLTAQLGMRLMSADRPDAEAISRWDPRVALAWQLAPETTLRTGWGRVHQIRDLTDIVPSQDGSLQLLPQRTDYYLLGADHLVDESTLLRIEGFHKSQLFLTPQQRNLLRSPSILPELSFDRVWLGPRSAFIRGVEITLQQQRDNWRWSGAWAYTARREAFAGGLLPDWDRRQSGALSLEVNSRAWLLSAAVNYRDGLPSVAFATNQYGGLVFDQRRASRLADSLTMDLRAKWRRPLGDGTLAVIAQVSNLFNNSSCCSEFAPLANSPPGAPQLTLRRQGSLPAIPYFGLAWDF
jgi:outer membrane receptor for ferrienterochelin and colicin